MTVVRLPLILWFVGWISIQNINATYYEHWSTSPNDASKMDIVITDISSSYDTDSPFTPSDIPILDNPISKERRYIPRKTTSRRHSHCPANEIFRRCHPKCIRKTCADYRIPVRCSHKDHGVCLSGCVCRSRYYRNANGVCVPREECLICNRDDEVFKCGPAWQETCDDESHPLQDLSNCEQGCYCRDGYVRNNRGFCIPKEDCPKNIKCTGDKIYRNCGDACPKTCENIADPDFGCSDEDYDCRPGCYCKEGFVENCDGDCVQLSDCYQCKKNEIYKDCRQQCPAQECGINPEVIRCAAPKPENCKAGCDCIDNYVRDDNGLCIPRDQCSENQCKKNEIYKDCRQQCPAQECGINPEVIRCAAPKPENCKAGCDCIDNYVRDDNGICIPRDQCPENQCKKNEIYKDCRQQCPAQECGINPEVIRCAAPKPENCKAGCDCIDNYVRDENGICIPRDQCPENRCKSNEVYKNCRQQCPLQKCGINADIIRCPRPKFEECQEGCDCIDGYVRDDNNKCIPRDKCPNTKPPQITCSRVNEYWHPCVAICKFESCMSLKLKYICPHSLLGKCSPKCICLDGYYRTGEGVCVKASNCFSPRCAVNEVWSECPDICKLETCNVLIHDYACHPIQPKICSPRCLCAEGFYRNDDRICVEASKCFEMLPKPLS